MRFENGERPNSAANNHLLRQTSETIFSSCRTV